MLFLDDDLLRVGDYDIEISSINGNYAFDNSPFENDILTILNNGYTPISFSELISYVENGTSLPQKPIVITMDDGYLSNYEYVFPYKILLLVLLYQRIF